MSYCGVTVNAGTRDELPDESGLAHLVEHTIFKGTTRRKACHIRTRMESVGGELNAYTTKEETVLYSIYPSAYHERAMELIGDLAAHASFPEAEFEKEREVVREEIDMYRDTPSELVYDEFENRLFAGHPLGRNILGTAEELSAMSPMQARAFMKRCYKAGEMAVEILTEGADPAEMPIETMSADECDLVYNQQTADSLGVDVSALADEGGQDVSA